MSLKKIRHQVDLFLSKIPTECPLARNIKVFGKTYRFAPCKLNPFYDQIIQAKFNALQRLADQ